MELSDEVGPFTTGEGARFVGVPSSLVGEREKGVLGRTEKETWEGREREEFEIFLEMTRCFYAGVEIFKKVKLYFYCLVSC